MIKQLSSNISVKFTRGKIDNWLVVVQHPVYPKAPTDTWYFTKLVELQENHPQFNVYEDFVTIWTETDRHVENHVLDIIEQLSAKYDYPTDAELIFLILYATMIAEENRAGTMLGSRIKRLGVHMLFFEGMTPEEAANASRGLKWPQIRDMCIDRGF